MVNKIICFCLFLTLLVSCGEDDAAPKHEEGPLPVITWVMSSGRFRIQTGESIQLVPDIEHLDETSVYTWTMEGDTIGHDTYYTFTTDSAGVYFIQLTVSNRYGAVSDEVKITVEEAENTELPEIPEHSGWGRTPAAHRLRGPRAGLPQSGAHRRRHGPRAGIQHQRLSARRHLPPQQ